MNALILGWPRTPYVEKAGLELRDSAVSASECWD